MSPKVRAFVDLARVSNLPTVWTNCIAGWVLGGGAFSWQLIPLLLGASVVYSAGMLLNDAADVEWDRHHRPERPIPKGTVSVKAAYAIGAIALVVGVLLFGLAGVAIIWALLLIAAIFVYNHTHKKWFGADYVMGACRMLLYVCAGSAGAAFAVANAEAGEMTASSWFPQLLVWIWGIAVGVYTVGVTLVARGESQDAPIDRLALGLLGAPVVAAFIAVMVRTTPSGALWLLSLAIWAGWTIWSVRSMRGDAEGRIRVGVANLLAGIVLIDAIAIAPAYGWLGLAIVVMLPITLLLQRKVAAT